MTEAELDERRRRMQQEALRRLAKSKQLNIRISEKSILSLHAIAGSQRKPVGAMVREWIMERIEQSENRTDRDPLYDLLEAVEGLDLRIERIEKLLGDKPVTQSKTHRKSKSTATPKNKQRKK
jgi:hypothetical protein